MTSLTPPTDGGMTSTSAPVLRPIEFGRLQVEVRLHEHELDVVFLHLVDEIECVLRCRRDTRFRFDVTNDVRDRIVPQSSERIDDR